MPVAPDEAPWTKKELAAIRKELEDEVIRLEQAMRDIRIELADLFDDGAESAGRDAIDIGFSITERDQELVLITHASVMLEDAQTALKLFDDGQYGWCESCGEAIGKERLQVFPRARLCVECKRSAERRERFL